jgi:hypothetical protein
MKVWTEDQRHAGVGLNSSVNFTVRSVVKKKNFTVRSITSPRGRKKWERERMALGSSIQQESFCTVDLTKVLLWRLRTKKKEKDR